MAKFKQFLTEEILINTFYNYLLEGTGFKLKEFVKDIPSERNKKFFKQRQEIGKTGSFLRDVIWNEKKDVLTLKYRVIPTFDKSVKTVNKNANIKTSKEYYPEIQFEDVESFLGSKKDFFTVLNKRQQDELFSLLVKDGTVKVHSTDMSWLYQGVWENASELGYSIYPFKGTKGKGIWSRRHKGESPAVYITKHLIEVINTIPFTKNTIVKKLRDKYQK